MLKKIAQLLSILIIAFSVSANEATQEDAALKEKTLRTRSYNKDAALMSVLMASNAGATYLSYDHNPSGIYYLVTNIPTLMLGAGTGFWLLAIACVVKPEFHDQLSSYKHQALLPVARLLAPKQKDEDHIISHDAANTGPLTAAARLSAGIKNLKQKMLSKLNK